MGEGGGGSPFFSSLFFVSSSFPPPFFCLVCTEMAQIMHRNLFREKLAKRMISY